MTDSRFSTDDHLSDELLSAWLDGELDATTIAQADRHLGSCRRCSERYAGMKAMRDALRHLEPLALPRDFRLTATGKPRMPGIARQPAGVWLAARLVSAAITFCGVLIFSLGLLSSTTINRNATSSAGALSYQHTSPTTTVCTTQRCLASQPAAYQTQIAQGTTNASAPATPTPGVAPTATPTPDAATTPTTATPTPGGSSLVGAGIPTTVLGVVLAILGIAGLLFLRPPRG